MVFSINKNEGGNLAASKIRNLECPSYEICLIDYGCGKFNRKIPVSGACITPDINPAIPNKAKFFSGI